MTYPVKWYDSTMQGAPALSGQAGKLIDVLDACLLNGFGTLTLDSLVVSGAVATATKSTGHTYLQHSVIEIAGASPSGLNGEKRVLSVTATTFTFDATGISDQTASGSTTAKVPAMGWTKAFSGTNKAVYARSDAAATAMVLRVDDTPAQYPALVMYESMSGVDTGTAPAPTSGSVYCHKSSSADATSRAWRLYADAFAVYVFIDKASSEWYSAFCFGDLVPYRSGDAYHCLLIAHPSSSTPNYVVDCNGYTDAAYLSRLHTQLGAAITCGRFSHRKLSTLGYGGAIPFPNPVDNSLLLWPVEAWDATAVARGLMPGAYGHLHGSLAYANGQVFQHADKLVKMQMSSAAAYAIVIDLTGPWR